MGKELKDKENIIKDLEQHMKAKDSKIDSLGKDRDEKAHQVQTL